MGLFNLQEAVHIWSSWMIFSPSNSDQFIPVGGVALTQHFALHSPLRLLGNPPYANCATPFLEVDSVDRSYQLIGIWSRLGGEDVWGSFAAQAQVHEQNGAFREWVPWSIDLTQSALGERQDLAGVIGGRRQGQGDRIGVTWSFAISQLGLQADLEGAARRGLAGQPLRDPAHIRCQCLANDRLGGELRNCSDLTTNLHNH